MVHIYGHTRVAGSVVLLALVVLLGTVAWWGTAASAQGLPPPAPVVYSGAVTVGGEPAPDGLQIVARILDYQSQPVLTTGGAYSLLTVGPPDGTYLFNKVTFHILDHELKALEEEALFLGGPAFVEGFDLTFPALPPLTPTPTPSPTPAATASPTPLSTPSAPPIAPVVYSGAVIVGGQPAPDGLLVVGRILDYESQSVLTTGGAYSLLTVAPPDGSYLFEPVTFHILAYEIKAGEEVAAFLGGPAFADNLTLTFPALSAAPPTPTATATPTPTPTPPPTPTPTQAPILSPTPDIEATVQALVQATLAAQITPTPTPNLEATIQAQIEATIAALTPTLTETPASPSPTPSSEDTPTPISAPVISTPAAEAVSTLVSEFGGEGCTRGSQNDLSLLVGMVALGGMMVWRRGRR